MFDKTIINRTETEWIPTTVNINRAPTDESIKLLNEFQEKALDNILCKITGDVYNDLKFECYFTPVVNVDFGTDGILILITRINGKEYKKKIRVRGNINHMLMAMKGSHKYIDIESKLQQFIYLQICLIVADVLCGNNQLENIVKEMSLNSITDFDFKTLQKLCE